MLFDSAWAGAEVEPDNQLLVDLDPGSYRVRATSLRASGNWMILVRLQQIIGEPIDATESAETR